MEEFKDKIVLISGGLGDIALGIARAYLQHGAVVLLSDRADKETASIRMSGLSDYKSRIRYRQVDVTDAGAVRNWVDSAVEEFGKIDISVVNAAQVTLKPFRELTADEWDNEMKVNLDGAFYFANASARAMMNKSNDGNIVFLGSWAGHSVHQHLPAYSVSKAAVRMLCQCMALEYAPWNIRINEVAPGYVNAGLSKGIWRDDPSSRSAAKSKVPLQELIEVEDIAKQVLWMTSSQNKHMTGATVLMDGGLSLVRP